jgi:molecular chaperone HscB
MTTFFELFGLKPSVDLDVKALEATHRQLALAHHPDRVTAADAKTRRLALERTGQLNEGLKVLRDPVRRAFYLLKLQGVDLENEQSAAKAQMPQAFLIEVLERREALEAAIDGKRLPQVESMIVEVEALRRQALAKANTALTLSEVDEAAHQLGRVRYFTRFLEEASAFVEAQETV